jgi:hypothetical protein
MFTMLEGDKRWPYLVPWILSQQGGFYRFWPFLEAEQVTKCELLLSHLDIILTTLLLLNRPLLSIHAVGDAISFGIAPVSP